MGYNTRYSLEVDNYDYSEVIQKFRLFSEGARWALTESGDCSDGVKWYDHQKDLKEFSKKYPKILFTLEGEGEESPDLWKLYVKNGKSQKVIAKITYDQFDSSKLI